MFAPLTDLRAANLWQWKISKDFQTVRAANPSTRRVLKTETKPLKTCIVRAAQHRSRREARENSVLSSASHTTSMVQNHLKPSKPVPDHSKAQKPLTCDIFMD